MKVFKVTNVFTDVTRSICVLCLADAKSIGDEVIVAGEDHMIFASLNHLANHYKVPISLIDHIKELGHDVDNITWFIAN